MDFPEIPENRQYGDRRADYVPSNCMCEAPTPIQINEYGNGEPATYKCFQCGEALNGDTKDDPFRRWPGDLVSGDVVLARRRQNEPAELRYFATQLPEFEQRKLRGLTGEKWTRAVKEAVERTINSRKRFANPSIPDTKPHRRKMRLIQEND